MEARHGATTSGSADQWLGCRRTLSHVHTRPTNDRSGTVHQRREPQEEAETTASVVPPQAQGPSPQAKTGGTQDNAQPTAATNDTVNRFAILMLTNLAVGQPTVKECPPAFRVEPLSRTRFLTLPPGGPGRLSESGGWLE